MTTAISSTRAIRLAMMELHTELREKTISNQSARVQINAARTVLESIKVELAVEALGLSPRMMDWSSELKAPGDETDQQEKPDANTRPFPKQIK